MSINVNIICDISFRADQIENLPGKLDALHAEIHAWEVCVCKDGIAATGCWCWAWDNDFASAADYWKQGNTLTVHLDGGFCVMIGRRTALISLPITWFYLNKTETAIAGTRRLVEQIMSVLGARLCLVLPDSSDECAESAAGMINTRVELSTIVAGFLQCISDGNSPPQYHLWTNECSAPN